MASTWITRRATKTGETRYRVEYRAGGREAPVRYGGSFKRKADADERRRWIGGELAARRIPDLRSLDQAVQLAPTVAEAVARWRDSRVDVTEGTRLLHRVALNRVLPVLGGKRVDELTVEDVNELVSTLAATGRKRETIKKSVKYLAAVLDESGRAADNPARGNWRALSVARRKPGRQTRRGLAASQRK